MQTLSQTYSVIREATPAEKESLAPVFVTGFKQRFIRRLILLNILWIALRIFKHPVTAFKKAKKLGALRDQYRSGGKLYKYAKASNRYFVNFIIPGWPSRSFNRFISHQFNRFSSGDPATLSTLLFAITKKCGFQCEHCCEWLNLNKPETLSKEDLLLIIHRFHKTGVAQVQLSGGEPLNRLNDIFYLLDNAPKDIDFWLYTTGYSLTIAKAKQLKRRGLTGITISLDHYEEDKHDAFRGVKGAYSRALKAVQYAREAGLIVCFSICATREFISAENLVKYAELAKQLGVSFIQLLEPKAVGHYAGQDVLLREHHQKILEHFFQTYNYHPGYSDYPIITYHGFITRQFGCSGSGADYVYVDTDGDVHNCPFCQRKIFSAFDDNLPAFIRQMKTKGCNALSACTIKNQIK